MARYRQAIQNSTDRFRLTAGPYCKRVFRFEGKEPMYESVKVAAISYRPAKWDKAVNADKMEELFVEAAREKPRMILITEGALEGYVVMEVVEGRASAEALIEVAEPIDGPYIRRFQKLARTLKTCLAFGVR